MTPELAYEERFAAVDNGAHTWAAAPPHVKEMWLAAWTISDAVNRHDERERIAAWLATQRNDTPAQGLEFSAALRACEGQS